VRSGTLSITKTGTIGGDSAKAIDATGASSVSLNSSGHVARGATLSSGNDSLYAGRGADVLTGGDGNDVFDFNVADIDDDGTSDQSVVVHGTSSVSASDFIF
jgi:hypothetical protein